MANPRPNEENTPKKRPFPMCSFNIPGWLPSSSTFNVSMEHLTQEIARIARDFIPDFTECTVELNRQTRDEDFDRRELHYFLWLPANSSHLVDKGSVGGNSILRKGLQEQSRQLKDFMRRFANPDNNRNRNADYRYGKIHRMDPASPMNRNEVGLVIDPIAFIDLIFDTSGTAYKNEFGAERPVVTRLNLSYHYKNREARLPESLTVTKFLKQASDGTRRTKEAIAVYSSR